MSSTSIEWPVKTREFHNHHFNSEIWNNFKFRDDDIIISTYGKAGTTWTQQIIAQLVFDGADEVNPSDLSPWVDLRIMPPNLLEQIEAQTHRRFLKTHLFVDALVFSSKAKYIYVARDGRDILMSGYNHLTRANDNFYSMINGTPGLVGRPLDRPDSDIRRFFNEWIDGDGYPLWSFWSHIQGWWDIRDLPNVEFLHFENLKKDMPGEIRRVAEFLDIPIDPETWPKILEHCSFDYMKENADRIAPMGGAAWEGGAKTFINKGTNGRWRDVLTAEDIAKYEAAASENLTPDCARWLATGELPD